MVVDSVMELDCGEVLSELWFVGKVSIPQDWVAKHVPDDVERTNPVEGRSLPFVDG